MHDVRHASILRTVIAAANAAPVRTHIGATAITPTVPEILSALDIEASRTVKVRKYVP